MAIVKSRHADAPHIIRPHVLCSHTRRAFVASAPVSRSPRCILTRRQGTRVTRVPLHPPVTDLVPPVPTFGHPFFHRRKMFALTQSAAVAPVRVVAKTVGSSKKTTVKLTVVAKSEPSTRRAALVGFTAVAALAAAKAANAFAIASQASSGGLSREYGRGQASSNASMSSYTLEGINTMSHSPKVKFGVMSDARAAAEAKAAIKYDAKADLVKGKK